MLHSLAHHSPLGRLGCHCIVASSPSLENVSMTLLCRQSLFGLLSFHSISVPPLGRFHPAESLLRIDNLLLAKSALSMFIYRLPDHSNKTGRSRPCHLRTTQVLCARTSDVLGVQLRPRVVVVKSFGSCPAGGSVRGVLRTRSPSPATPSPLGLCRLLTQGTRSGGFNSCGCQKR